MLVVASRTEKQNVTVGEWLLGAVMKEPEEEVRWVRRVRASTAADVLVRGSTATYVLVRGSWRTAEVAELSDVAYCATISSNSIAGSPSQ